MVNTQTYPKSASYRERVHNFIPGGAHTYSKGDDQFPSNAPAAFESGKGAYLRDVDGRTFLDCCMGLTSVSLGHAYEPVLARVRAELERGVNFQRPSVIELEMAEAFLASLPGHDRIKFAKNGSSVTTAAVKLARAYTGRKLVAFPGDHPFYSYDDWFIGKTKCNFGVPEEFSALSVTYQSDNLASLTELFERHPGQIACVISEPEKPHGVPEGYIQSAIELAHRYGALYIIDEMITGYRVAFPGALTKHGVTPDMATWGKGIANGFSFCALTGKREILDLGGIKNEGQRKLFLISTTHGGETHAIGAALATREVFLNENVNEHNTNVGRQIVAGSLERIEAAGLRDFVKVLPCNWMPSFSFHDRQGEVSAGMRTLLMQEMIQRGVLFQGTFVPCFSHGQKEIDTFLDVFQQCLRVYGQALEDGYEKYLNGPVARAVFREFI